MIGYKRNISPYTEEIILSKRTNNKKWLCLDCNVHTGDIYEHYFVNTSLWLSVVDSKNGMLCIGCLENRLGRMLKRSDFTDASINNPKHSKQSLRLKNRLDSI